MGEQLYSTLADQQIPDNHKLSQVCKLNVLHQHEAIWDSTFGRRAANAILLAKRGLTV